MKKRYVTLSFNKLSMSAFIRKAQAIQVALSAPMFNTIQPSPGEVNPLIDQLVALCNLTALRNYSLKGERDAIRIAIEDLLSRQCSAVNTLAHGDMNILLQSGFDVSKIPSAMPLPVVPYIKNVTAGCNDGEVAVYLKGCKQAKSYVLEVRDMDNNLIREAVSTKVHAVINMLPVGVTLRVRVCAINARGRSLWTVNYPFMIGVVDGSQGVFTLSTNKDKNNNRNTDAA